MQSPDDNARFAYCKYGDVVAQLTALGPCPEHVPDGGPDTYAANFLRFTCGKPVLLMSYCDRSRVKSISNVTARAYRKKFKNPLVRVLAWTNIFISTFYYLLRFKPTKILCAASGSPLWACYLVSGIRGIPFVHSRHARFTDQTNSGVNNLSDRINTFIIKRASAVICHGPYLKEQMLMLGVQPDRLYEFNISYRYLIADSQEHEQVIPNITEHGRYRCILFIGTVSRQKGVFDLFEASKNILHSDKSLRLIYIGKGPDLHLLEKKISSEKLHEQILTLGHVDHELLPLLIRQSILLVTPTRIEYPESRCKAAIEGMILGKPVIVPDFGPFPYVFKHGYNGMLYQPNSVTDLRDKISAVLTDDVLYSSLLQGVRESGKKLLDAPLSFQQALKLAFRNI